MISNRRRFWTTLTDSQTHAIALARMANRFGHLLASIASIFLLAFASAVQCQPGASSGDTSDAAKQQKLSACQSARKLLEQGALQPAQDKAKAAIINLEDPSTFDEDLECFKAILAKTQAQIALDNPPSLSECQAARRLLTGGTPQQAQEKALTAIKDLKDSATFDTDLECLKSVRADALAESIKEDCNAIEKALAKGQPKIAQEKAEKLIDSLQTHDESAFSKGLQCLSEVVQKAAKETEQKEKKKIEDQLAYFGRLGKADQVQALFNTSLAAYPPESVTL